MINVILFTANADKQVGPCWCCLLQVQLASIREMSINNLGTGVYQLVQELYLRLVSAFAQCMVLSVALVRKTWRRVVVDYYRHNRGK